MSVYDQIAWLPICGGLTGVGLVLSWLALRRRGVAAGLRGAAWSLLPLAAYLTGAIKMFWRIGAAIGAFAVSFVFSPVVWAGIVVTGLAVVLFVVSGAMRGRRAAKQQPGTPGRTVAPGTRPAKALDATQPHTPAGKGRGKAAAPGEEDFGEVTDILRKHGIR